MDDSSGTIGRRYARNDELGTPFAVTVDFQSLKDGTITLRERDSTRQVRGPLEEILKALGDLCGETKTWKDVEASLPSFSSQEV